MSGIYYILIVSYSIVLHVCVYEEAFIKFPYIYISDGTIVTHDVAADDVPPGELKSMMSADDAVFGSDNEGGPDASPSSPAGTCDNCSCCSYWCLLNF